MPIEAKAQIVIKGGSESLKTLQGVKRGMSEAAREAQKANKAQEAAIKAQTRATEAAARAQQKAARDTAKAHEKSSRDAARAADKAQRDIERAAQKEADRWRELAQKSRDVRIRAMEAATRAAQREAAKQIEIAKKTAAAEAQARKDAWRRAGGLLTAGTAGLLAGAATAAGTARGIAGVKDVRERITSANEFRERLVLATGAAGMTAPQREAVQGQVLAASQTTGKDIGELMGVLETGQAQFNNLKFFADNLREIATISKAAGADTGELAKALGYVQKAFGLSGEEAMEAAYLMKASADKGSVELKDFAAHFASAAGIFASNTGQTGMAGVRQFLGASQAVGTGGFDPSESATRMTQAISFLNRVSAQKELKSKAGVDMSTVIGKDGKIDVGRVLDALAGSKKFMSSAGVRQEIFSDVQAREGIMAMLTARQHVLEGRTGAIDFNSIAGVNAAEGKGAVAATMKSMEGEGFFKMQQEAARMQADTVANLEKYNADILMVAQTTNRLEEAFGRLSLWANSIAAVGVVGGVVNTIGKLANAGGGGGALAKALPSVANAGTAVASGAGGLLAAGSTAVGAATAGAIAGTVGAGLAIGGAVGYGINEITSAVRADEKSASDLLADLIFEAVNSNDARFKEGSRIENTNEDGTKQLVTIMKENNQKLEQINQGLRTTNTKPDAGAPREPR